MNQNLKTKYAIKFENKIFDFNIIGKQIVKIISTNVGVLNEFLFSWDNPADIGELLLPDIFDALSGLQGDIQNGSETVLLLINYHDVCFFQEGEENVVIPTNDFNEIVLAWKEFLETPPLSGTKV
jgi:hypothetical protein